MKKINTIDGAASRAYMAWAGSDAPPWEILADEDQGRWRKVVCEAAPLSETLCCGSYHMELCESALDVARDRLGGPPWKLCTIVASTWWGRIPRELSKKLKCSFVETPSEVLLTPRVWAFVTPNGTYYSLPN